MTWYDENDVVILLDELKSPENFNFNLLMSFSNKIIKNKNAQKTQI